MSSPDGLTALVARIDAELATRPAAPGVPDVALMGSARVSRGGERQRHVLQFGLGGRRYAVDSSQLIELTHVPPITAVPGLPAFVRGLANFRGRIVTVLDPGSDPTSSLEPMPSRRMAVVRGAGNRPTGILVDASYGINTLFGGVSREASTAPDEGRMLSAFVTGVVHLDGEDVALVDLSAWAVSVAVSAAERRPT